MKHTEKLIPFGWDDWEEHDILLNSYYNVEFTEDFGEFKKGEKFSSITVDYIKGIIEAFIGSPSDDLKIKTVTFKATPI